MEISPYHLVKVAADESQRRDNPALFYWKTLPTQYIPGQHRQSLGIDEVSKSLILIMEHRARRDMQTEIIRNVFKQAFNVSEGNATLEIFLLLKILMPQYDIDNVYGIKTKRLIRLFENIIKYKFGYPEDALLLAHYIVNPKYERLEKGAIVSRPEHMIAYIVAAIKHKRNLHASAHYVTVQDVGIMCASLTRCYLSNSDSLDAMQSEILYNAALHMGRDSLELFLKVILKKVTVGVGPKTVLLSMLNIDANTLFEKQHDIAYVANMCTKHANDPGEVWQKQTIHIICGIPFTPMTCKVLKSPYLFKWIFSTEEKLKKPISPIDGRLVIVASSESWYIPMKHNAMQKSYFNIESKSISKNRSRRDHIKWLRQFKKENILNHKSCEGLIIHYTLSIENKTQTVMLIRMLSNAIENNVELYDELASGELIKVESIVESFSANESFDLKNEQEIESQIEKILNKLPVSSRDDGLPATEKLIARNAFKKTPAKKKYPNLLKSKQKTSKVKEITEKEENVIVQVKYDGDRIQIHAKKVDSSPPQKKMQIKLFTKSGRDVSDMYSTIKEELENFEPLYQYTPCIFDGELLVVDEKEKPLPWNNEKWRYNDHKAQDPDPPHNTGKHIVSFVYDENEDGGLAVENRSDAYEDECISFVYNDKVSDAAKIIQGKYQTKKIQTQNCKLMVIVYDILMHNGDEVHQRSCMDRLIILKEQYNKIFKGTRHVRVIEATYEINNTTSLLELLKESVVQQYEGLILKDPSSEYEFKKSNRVQKLKISGPDINTYVAGAGFSLSSNPRQWGFLTCVRINEETMEVPQFMAYVRTEVFEGSEPWRGFEIVTNLKSKKEANQIFNGKTDPVTTLNVGEGDHACVLTIFRHHLIDIQWLCSPLECPFGISIRGDLWPISKSTSEPMLLIPRNPVGRMELNDFQMSPCDSVTSIEKKYKEASSIHTSLETAMIFKALSHFRCKHPKNDKNLQTLRKVLLAFNSKDTKWPQAPPRMGYSLDEYAQLLADSMVLCNSNPNAKSSFKPLSSIEKLVLGQIPVVNEWATYFEKVNKQYQHVPTIEENEEEEQLKMNIDFLTKRLSQLRNIPKPIVTTASQFDSSTNVCGPIHTLTDSDSLSDSDSQEE